MEIKRTLKNMDVRISKLATDLGISRPTLDTYIEYYENQKPIPNQTYQVIFDYLFSTECSNTIEFARRFDYVKRTFLASYKAEETQTHEQRLRDSLSDYAFMPDADKDMLEFVNLFITNGKIELVQAISRYFNFVNGLKKFDAEAETEKNKALFSKLFRVFLEYQQDNIITDDSAYRGFVEKSDRIFSKKEDADPVNTELLEYLGARLPEGSNIDLDYIKKLLEKKEN